MQWTPHVTVAAIIRSDNRFLLVEEYGEDGRPVFNQPAGHLEEHETLIDAVIREVLEESGWHFHPTYMTGIYQHHDNDNGITYLRFCFHGDCSGQDDRRPLDKGIIRTVWMTLDEMHGEQARMRSPLVIRCVEDYLAGQRHPLSLLPA